MWLTLRRSLVVFLVMFISTTSMFWMFAQLPQKISGTRRTAVFPLTTPMPTPLPTPGLSPVTLIIPKLGIQTAVEGVGLTVNHNMEVPQSAANVGWYMFGPKPSEPGNAVLAGHYDTPTGKPAIFYSLNKLDIGDKVEVISENAVRSVFIVEDKMLIPENQFPVESLFNAENGRNLVLITCAGIWDTKLRNYSQRVVITAKLETESAI